MFTNYAEQKTPTLSIYQQLEKSNSDITCEALHLYSLAIINAYLVYDFYHNLIPTTHLILQNYFPFIRQRKWLWILVQFMEVFLFTYRLPSISNCVLLNEYPHRKTFIVHYSCKYVSSLTFKGFCRKYLLTHSLLIVK